MRPPPKVSINIDLLQEKDGFKYGFGRSGEPSFRLSSLVIDKLIQLIISHTQDSLLILGVRGRVSVCGRLSSSWFGPYFFTVSPTQTRYCRFEITHVLSSTLKRHRLCLNEDYRVNGSSWSFVPSFLGRLVLPLLRRY